jgi:O-antigen/teichoic acid export membrane protein
MLPTLLPPKVALRVDCSSVSLYAWRVVRAASESSPRLGTAPSGASDPDPRLGTAARSGVRWQAAAQGIDAASALALTIVLAHLISPRIFGLVGLASSIAAILSVVLTGPVTSAIVSQHHTSSAAVSTAWWLVVVPALVALLVASLIALVFVPGIDARLAVIGGMLTVPVGAVAQIQTSVYQRELAFRRIAIAGLVGTFGSVIGSLLLAITGHSVLALVARMNLTGLLMTLVLTAMGERFPRLEFDRKIAKEIYSYARGLIGFNGLNQLARNGDNLLIGSFLGSTPLGLYSLAYRFITFPLNQAAQLAQTVLFPTLARINDRSEFDRLYLRSIRLLLWLIAPVGICAIVVGDLATVSLLGDKWRAAGPVVRIIGVVAIIQAVDTHSGILFMVRQQTRLFFRWSAIWGPVALLSFVIGLPWGIEGVAGAYLGANVVVLYPYWQLVFRLVDFGAAVMLRTISIEIVLAGVVVAAGLGARSLVVPRSAIGVVLASGVLTIGYWVVCLFLDATLRSDIFGLIPNRLHAIKPT